MNRRAFLCGPTLGLLAALSAAHAQSQKPVRIGFLAIEPSPSLEGAFRNSLRALGYIDGQNLLLEYRYPWPGGGLLRDRLRQPAADLVALGSDIIVAHTPGALALKAIGATTPVVFIAVSDPVAFGFVSTLARPGGNMTGISYQGLDLNAKRLELLKEAVPRATRVGVLGDGGHQLLPRMMSDLETAGRALNLQLHLVRAGPEATTLEPAFDTLVRERVDALFVLQSANFYAHRKRVAELATKTRLAGIFEVGEFAEAGGLLSYAPNLIDLHHRAAVYADKILKGAKPADLPVEQPTTFELVINLRTAKAIGLTIPPSVLLRADRIIE